MEPLYIKSLRSGLLAEKEESARKVLEECTLCPRACGVDRLAGERGICRAGLMAEISSAGPHFGEEPPLVGWGGSGTIFLTHCSLRCVFCQNSDISHEGRGHHVTAEDLGGIMISLQRRGCHNINLVTPTHYLPQILGAVVEAAAAGLTVPLVWNCSGYERREILELLEGVVDIYMPDMKFAGDGPADRFCGAPDYFEKAAAAIHEMHRQVGDLEIDSYGLARRGLLVRHLVLPGALAGTGEIMRFLAEDISPHTYVNVMDQYRPSWEAHSCPDIARPTTSAEYREAVGLAEAAGLRRGDR